MEYVGTDKRTQIFESVAQLKDAFHGMVDTDIIQGIMDIANEDGTDVGDVREKARFLLACYLESKQPEGEPYKPVQTFTVRDILSYIDAKTIERVRTIVGGGDF